MVNVGIFYDHLEYFMAIWYSLWSFVICLPNLVCLDQEKSGIPVPQRKDQIDFLLIGAIEKSEGRRKFSRAISWAQE
jgi:hypothetical protein